MKRNILYLIIIFLIFNCSWNNPYAPGWLADIIEEVVTPEPSPETPTPSARPLLLGAVSTGFITVELSFDRNLDQTEAEDTGNYSITSVPDLTIEAADLLMSDPSTVRLMTDLQQDQQYTITASDIRAAGETELIAAPNGTANFAGIGYTPSEPFKPDVADATVDTNIQAAIDTADPGDVIYIFPGTYTENIIIDKQIVLLGAGSGSDPASNTILDGIGDPEDWHTIRITQGGTSSAARVVIMNIRLIRDQGTGNNGTPINIDTADGHIKFENIAVVNNGGRGICFDPAGSTQDVILNYCNISNNGNQGFRIPSTVPHIEGLVFSYCSFYDNGGSGIYSENEVDPASNITITNCAFSSNATNVYQTGDILLSNYRGDLTISNVFISSSDCESGIRLSGRSAGGGVGYPAGTVVFSDLTITGTQISLGAYPSSAITFTRYSDVSNVTFSNVTLNSNAPHSLFLGTITSTPLDIGTIVFAGTYDWYIYLGTHGNSGSYTATNVPIDATQAIFVDATSDAYIEERVWDFDDNSTLGDVDWTPP